MERLTGDIGTLPHYHSTREDPGVFVLVDYQGRCQGMVETEIGLSRIHGNLLSHHAIQALIILRGVS